MFDLLSVAFDGTLTRWSWSISTTNQWVKAVKFLCFSDLHRDVAAAEQLVGLAKDVDLVIGAGDFATRRQGVEDTIEVLAEIEKPSVLVPGNGESVSELESAVKSAGWSSARVLHGTGCKLETVEIWGVGGGIPVTPLGDWSYDFSEAQAESLLAGCKPMSVLVTHSPPLDTVDEDRSGKIRGSQAIRDVVLAKKPKLVVCGHIHSDWGKQVRLGETLVVNAGPRGMIIEVDFSEA